MVKVIILKKNSSSRKMLTVKAVIFIFILFLSQIELLNKNSSSSTLHRFRAGSILTGFVDSKCYQGEEHQK